VIKARPPTARPSKVRSVRKGGSHPDWSLVLYVAGPSPKSTAAFRNLEQICEDHLVGHYHIEVIDLIKNPQIALDDQIVAVPMAMRKWPLPIRKVIGDMSNTERVMTGLDLRPFNASPFAVRKAKKDF
jgi:circadian clock protein KaiB